MNYHCCLTRNTSSLHQQRDARLCAKLSKSHLLTPIQRQRRPLTADGGPRSISSTIMLTKRSVWLTRLSYLKHWFSTSKLNTPAKTMDHHPYEEEYSDIVHQRLRRLDSISMTFQLCASASSNSAGEDCIWYYGIFNWHCWFSRLNFWRPLLARQSNNALSAQWRRWQRTGNSAFMLVQLRTTAATAPKFLTA